MSQRIEYRLLEYLREHVPSTLRAELLLDGAPDIEHTKIEGIDAVDALLRPLNDLAFPTEDLYDRASLLSWIMLGYAEDREQHHTAKLIYVCAHYIHSYALEGSYTQCGATCGALCLLLEAAYGFDGALNELLIDFVVWAIENGVDLDQREDCPKHHLAVGLMCLLQRQARLTFQTLLDDGRLALYYRDILADPEDSPVHQWKRMLRDQLNRVTRGDAKAIVDAFDQVLEWIEGASR